MIWSADARAELSSRFFILFLDLAQIREVLDGAPGIQRHRFPEATKEEFPVSRFTQEGGQESRSFSNLSYLLPVAYSPGPDGSFLGKHRSFGFGGIIMRTLMLGGLNQPIDTLAASCPEGTLEISPPEAGANHRLL